MQLKIYCETGESLSNIGMAKALIETNFLQLDDLREIAQHLLVFVENNSIERNVGGKAD